MDQFIDKEYPTKTLAVLNNVRIYVRVVVLIDISIQDGTNMAKWALQAEKNEYHK